MAKRLFIALKIRELKSLLDIYNEIRTDLKGEKIKWVESGNLHLTFTFLGDTEENLISQLTGFMDETACDYNEFNMVLKSFGVFKNIKDPNVLWFGVEHNNMLSNIKKTLDIKLNNAGFPVENRDFKPHLTIGRPKYISDKAKLQKIIEKYDHKEISNQRVNEIILFESILTPNGPVYNLLHKSALR